MKYIVKNSDIVLLGRGGESPDSKGSTGIGWAIEDIAPHKLPSGFGKISDAECVPKLLDYDEVIYVIDGTLNIEIDSVIYQGEAGDVFNLPSGTTVKYSGKNAKFFFVTTPTY